MRGFRGARTPTETEHTVCTDMHGNTYPDHTNNPGNCHRCGAAR